MASETLIWELVKNYNKFLVKRNGNSNASVQFSSEPNNLYNLNTYKYSGLANKKTLSIAAAGEGSAVVLGTTKAKKWNKPAVSVHRSTLKRDFPRTVKVVRNQVVDNKYRPDLEKAAVARLSAVRRSLCGKTGSKKRKASQKKY